MENEDWQKVGQQSRELSVQLMDKLQQVKFMSKKLHAVEVALSTVDQKANTAISNKTKTVSVAEKIKDDAYDLNKALESIARKTDNFKETLVEQQKILATIEADHYENNDRFREGTERAVDILNNKSATAINDLDTVKNAVGVFDKTLHSRNVVLVYDQIQQMVENMATQETYSRTADQTRNSRYEAQMIQFEQDVATLSRAVIAYQSSVLSLNHRIASIGDLMSSIYFKMNYITAPKYDKSESDILSMFEQTKPVEDITEIAEVTEEPVQENLEQTPITANIPTYGMATDDGLVQEGKKPKTRTEAQEAPSRRKKKSHWWSKN